MSFFLLKNINKLLLPLLEKVKTNFKNQKKIPIKNNEKLICFHEELMKFYFTINNKDKFNLHV
jgi:hypothetical protein